jgi:hypothetical protein
MNLEKSEAKPEPVHPPRKASSIKLRKVYKEVTLLDIGGEAAEALSANASALNPDRSSRTMVVHMEPTSVRNGRGLSIPFQQWVKTRFGPKKTDGLFVATSDTIILGLSCGSHITCTPGHKLFTGEGWVESETLGIGDPIETEFGLSYVTSVQNNEERTPVFDVCVPGPHEYYANKIVSHNSILANQLTNNQAQMGYHVDITPLEMATKEMVSRTISAQSGKDSIDILLRRLSDADKELVYKRMKRFNRRIAKAGGRLNVFKPRTDMTMEEIMSALHALGSDVTYIDYISLLAGVGGDDAWQKLGEVARFGKIFAEIHNRVVVLLAQVSEEGKIRYSQAIKEHASVAWTFGATEESREKGYLNIDTLKSRNQVRFPFTLKIQYNTTSVSDLSSDEMRQLDEETQARKSARKSGRRGPAKSEDGTDDPRQKSEASEDDMLPELD